MTALIRPPERGHANEQGQPGGLLEAKLAVPRPAFRVLHRTRLTRLLDDTTRRRVTLLSAAAGSGKTTACASWAQSREGKAKIAWVSLDRADNDPGRFRSYLVAALRRAGVPLAEGVGDAGSAPPDDFPLLVVRAAERYQEPVVLILDDVHELTGGVVLDWLDKLVRYAPQGLTFVLSGRRPPPLQLARLRLGGELIDIDAAALACTREEADSYVTMAGIRADSADLDRLLRHTEGWMAGLRLAALITQARRAGTGPAGLAGDNPIVTDYLRDEVLAGHDARMRTFLQRTSIARTLTGDLADALTATGDGARFLDRLSRENNLVGKDGAGRAWYRYHPLLREMLLAGLRREMPEEIPILSRRAARWYAQHEMPVEALRTSIEAPDLDFAARVFADSDIAILMSRGAGELDRALALIPPDAAAGDPVFGAAQAASHLWRGDPAAAHAHLDMAENALDRVAGPLRPIVETKLTALRVIHASSVSCPGQDMLERASSAAGEMTRGAGTAAEHRAVGVLWWALGVAHMRRSELPQACQALRLADRELGIGAFPALRARAHAWGALCQAWQGKLTGAARIAADVLDTGRPASPGTRDIARLALAFVNMMRDEPAAVHRLLDQIDYQDHVRLPGEPPVEASATVIRTRTLLGERDIARARAFLSKLEERSGRRTPAMTGFIASLHGELVARSGDGGLRRELIARLMDAAGPTSPAGLSGNIILPWLLIAEDSPDKALTAVGPALDDRLEMRLHDRISALLAAAVAHRRHRRGERASDLLEQALALAEPEDMYRPFLDGGPAVQSALTVLIEPSSSHAGFSRKILQRADAQLPNRPATPDSAIPALTESEISVLRFLPSQLTNEEIGDALFLSVNTVKTHVRSIYRKLGVRSRREAIALARRHHLVA